MNLASLMYGNATPRAVCGALIEGFETVDHLDIEAGGYPFQTAIVARDADGPRLVILVLRHPHGWAYQPHSPVILKQLRLESESSPD